MRIGDFKESYAADEALLRTATARVLDGVLLAALATSRSSPATTCSTSPTWWACSPSPRSGSTPSPATPARLLGHAAFMGVGAYGTAVAATRFGLPFWLAVPAGGLAACLAGAVVGVPSLRIKGLYLAIATLAAQVIFEWVFTNWTGVTGGIRGINVAPASLLGFGSTPTCGPTTSWSCAAVVHAYARRTSSGPGSAAPSWRCATATSPPSSWA